MNKQSLASQGPGKNYLFVTGRKDVKQTGNVITLPLIDDQTQDKAEFIDPIWQFLYCEIYNKAMQNYANDTKLASKIIEAINFEFANAARGLVEFYRGSKIIQDSLEKTGFREIQKQVHEKNPFFNLTAVK